MARVFLGPWPFRSSVLQRCCSWGGLPEHPRSLRQPSAVLQFWCSESPVYGRCCSVAKVPFHASFDVIPIVTLCPRRVRCHTFCFTEGEGTETTSSGFVESHRKPGQRWARTPALFPLPQAATVTTVSLGSRLGCVPLDREQ